MLLSSDLTGRALPVFFSPSPHYVLLLCLLLPFLFSGKPRKRNEAETGEQGGLKGWKASSLLALGTNGQASVAPLTRPNYLTGG